MKSRYKAERPTLKVIPHYEFMGQDIFKGNCLLSSARSNWRIPRTMSRLICAWSTQQQPAKARTSIPNSISLWPEGHNRNEALEFYSQHNRPSSFWPAVVFTPHKYIDFTLFCASENV